MWAGKSEYSLPTRTVTILQFSSVWGTQREKFKQTTSNVVSCFLSLFQGLSNGFSVSWKYLICSDFLAKIFGEQNLFPRISKLPLAFLKCQLTLFPTPNDIFVPSKNKRNLIYHLTKAWGDISPNKTQVFHHNWIRISEMIKIFPGGLPNRYSGPTKGSDGCPWSFNCKTLF